jgi:hypothetical protein
MTGSDSQMREAIEDLWIEVFGEPPSIRCEPGLLAEVLIRSLSPPPPYGDPPARRDREPLAPHHPGRVTNQVERPN